MDSTTTWYRHLARICSCRVYRFPLFSSFPSHMIFSIGGARKGFLFRVHRAQPKERISLCVRLQPESWFILQARRTTPGPFFSAMSESCSPPPSFLSDASDIGVGGIPVLDPSSLGSFCRVLIGPGFLLGHESGIGGPPRLRLKGFDVNGAMWTETSRLIIFRLSAVSMIIDMIPSEIQGVKLMRTCDGEPNRKWLRSCRCLH